MTKYFKLLGVALLATTLCFTSCTKGDDPTTDPGTENPDPGTGEPDPGTGGGDPVADGIKVTFGSESWEAVQSVGAYMADYGIVAAIAVGDQSGKPRMDAYVYASSTGTITDQITEELTYANESIYRLEYYLEGGITLTYQDGTQGQFGDWWAKSATINVTGLDLTAMTLSANINAVMFDFMDIVADGYVTPSLLPSAQTQNMTATIKNLVIEMAKGSVNMSGVDVKAIVR
jgi:hypothetical protein